MSNLVSSFYMLGVAEAEMLLQFPFLVREKGALIDRQSLSCISLPQVATDLRFACRARSVGGDLREQRAKLTCLHVNLGDCRDNWQTCLPVQPDQVVYLDDSNLCSCIALFAESGLADGCVPDTAKW